MLIPLRKVYTSKALHVAIGDFVGDVTRDSIVPGKAWRVVARGICCLGDDVAMLWLKLAMVSALLLAGCSATVGTSARNLCSSFVEAIERRDLVCGHSPIAAEAALRENLAHCDRIDYAVSEADVQVCIDQVEQTRCEYTADAAGACAAFKEVW